MAKRKKKVTKAKAQTPAGQARGESHASREEGARRRSRASKATRAPVQTGAKQQYLHTLNREHATTLKVMRAYPDDQHGLQPHARSSTAKQLLWTFVIENELLRGALDGTLTMPPTFPSPPETIPEIISAYEGAIKKVMALVAAMPEGKMAKTIPFFTGPRQMGQVPIGDIMWLMLMDSIHHRGQLSVYIRMAGGRVPSIYGPSADEPWN